MPQQPRRDVGGGRREAHRWRSQVWRGRVTSAFPLCRERGLANDLRFCCAATYPNLTDSMIGGELGGWGGVSSKRVLGGTSSGRPAPASRRPILGWPARAGQPWNWSSASLP